MPSHAIRMSHCWSGSAVPSGATKCAVTRPELCSTPVHPLQVGPQQRDVRPLVTGRLAERLAIDELAVASEEGVVLRLAGGRDQCVLEAQRAQLLHRMGADIDADAQRPHLRRRLEQTDCVRRAARLKRESQRQPTDPAADDDNVHSPLLARWNRGKSTPPAALVCTQPDCKIPAAIYGARQMDAVAPRLAHGRPQLQAIGRAPEPATTCGRLRTRM
jgi:hypothetical protein